jgi:hypothetical protein
MEPVNRMVRAALNAALTPFEQFPPLVGLSAVSLVVAIAMLLVFRKTSDQPAITKVKRRIQAGIFEVRLFNDDIRALHGVRDVLRHNLTYLRLSLAPLPWLIVPLALVIAHLQFYYGYEGFVPGQTAVVKVRLSESHVTARGAFPGVALRVPAGLSVQTPAVWIASSREAAWRIGLGRAGDYEIVVTLDGRTATKTVRVSDQVGWRSPGRYDAAFLNQLLYPAEPPIARDVPLEAIEVSYPESKLHVLGLTLDWMMLFFGLSLVFAWMLSARFGVTL